MLYWKRYLKKKKNKKEKILLVLHEKRVFFFYYIFFMRKHKNVLILRKKGFWESKKNFYKQNFKTQNLFKNLFFRERKGVSKIFGKKNLKLRFGFKNIKRRRKFLRKRGFHGFNENHSFCSSFKVLKKKKKKKPLKMSLVEKGILEEQ